MAIDGAIDVAVEEVADNLEELAEATRAINTTVVGYFIAGVCVGASVGFYFGYKFNREKIKADAFKKSEEEIETIREMYQIRDERKAREDAAQQKAVTVVVHEKPSVESIVEQKGYDVPVTAERPLPAPVPVRDTAGWITTSTGTSVYGAPSTSSWSYPEELANRTKDEPYVIHQDEFNNSETNYDQVSYTYYAEDDVVVGVDDRPIPHADIVVGQNNLKWGHGTTDADLVHIRNDKLELEIEISRIPGSFEREVLGIEPDESS